MYPATALPTQPHLHSHPRRTSSIPPAFPLIPPSSHRRSYPPQPVYTMHDPFRPHATFTRAVDDFISPTGSALAAALAAAQSSTTGLPVYSDDTNQFSASIPSPMSTPPTTILRTSDDPSLGLKHDFMVMAGVNMESTAPGPPHRDPIVAALPWPAIPDDIGAAHGTGASTNARPFEILRRSMVTTSSVTRIPSSPRSLGPVGGVPPKRKHVVATAAGPAGARKRGVRKKLRGPARFFCQLVGCGKAFRTQGDLQTHMRLHTGEEPFQCSFPFCGRRYKWRSSLAHHESLHLRKKGALSQKRPRRSKSTLPMSIGAVAGIGEGSQQADSGSKEALEGIIGD